MTGLSDNALHVLRARYLRRAEDRSLIETPDEMFARVAHAIAAAEKGRGTAAEAEGLFRAGLTSLDFLPNSPTLMNAGAEQGQLSACFVLPVEDSIESIFEAVKRLALIQRTGGGTGFSFSRLRPRGDSVASTGGESSGPVSFLKIFDAATEHIKQGGRRRGANMGILRVDHPDILEFIAVKSDGRSVRNFNLSVGVTDAFMEVVRRDGSFDLTHPRTRQSTGRMRAREVLDAIVQNAWLTGDPGLVFLDTINRANPTPHLGDIEATNPCGEVPLLPHEACNLGSINLAHMLRVSGDSNSVDWNKLRATTRLAVRFLDDVIDANHYPLPEIERMAQGNRKIGLGVMGFADMLIGLGISYDSDEAVVFADQLMSFIATEAQAASCDLAVERGVYPNWPGSRHEARGLRVRNATCTAIAPTGTIGIIAGASPGIEPLFALAYRRTNVLGGETLSEVSPLFVQAARLHVPDAGCLIAAVAESGSLSGVPDVPESMRRLFVTAHEIPAGRHLEIQAAFQRHVDNSVSKTINLPAETTPEEVSLIYQRAWELGLKGITVFRQDCRPEQVMEPGLHAPSAEMACAARCDPGECDL